MNAEHEFVVLRDQVSLAEVVAFVDERGFTLVDDTTRGYFILATKAWATSDGTQLAYVEDHTADVRHIQTAGPDRIRLATAARERLANYDPSELLSIAQSAEDPRTCIQTISRLVPYRPEDCAPRFLAAWERMIAHPVKAVRRAAIRTAYGCRWPQLRALIERRLPAEDELEPQLRHLLRLFDEPR